MKPPRLTIRTLMVAIVVLAVGLAIPGWLKRRQVRFGIMSKNHQKISNFLIDKYKLPFRQVNYLSEKDMEQFLKNMSPEAPIAARLVKYHWKMEKKYNYLEMYPWYFDYEDKPYTPPIETISKQH